MLLHMAYRFLHERTCIKLRTILCNLRTPVSVYFTKKAYSVKSLKASCPSAWCSLGILTYFRFAPHFTSVYCEDDESSYPVLDITVPERYMWTFNDLISVLWPEVMAISLAVLAALTAALMNVIIPIFLGDVADAITGCIGNGNNIATMYVPACKLCSAYVSQSLATFLYIGLLGAAGERIAQRLRIELFDKLVHRGLAYFDIHNAGKLMDCITADVQSFKSSFKQCVSHGLRGITQVIGSSCALFAISSPLTLLLVGSLPCVFLIGGIMGSELRRLSRKAQTQSLMAASMAEESFTHIRSVKALALEDAQLDRFRSELDSARRLSEQLAYAVGLFQGLSNLALNGIVLTVLFVGGHLLSSDQLKPGHLLSFLATTQTMQRSLAQLSLLYAQVIRGSNAFNRISGILKMSNFVDAPLSREDSCYATTCSHEKWQQPGFAPSIQFNSIQFSYPNRSGTVVLDSLNLSVPAGKVVALVGKSGAGKSTVVSLVERFYDPLSGKITLGNHDICEFSLALLRGQLIGYISQEPQIFNTSVRENIRFGRPDATDQQVEEAARLANAHEFIVTQLPQGYDTLVGRGSDETAGLSGGQRQRIAIARILLKNSPILLLDEATSALDAESEAQVQEALKTVMKGRTVLVIAHRLSTVRNADLIVVMSEGRIVEQGTHRELMAKRGHYYDLVRTQEDSVTCSPDGQ